MTAAVSHFRPRPWAFALLSRCSIAALGALGLLLTSHKPYDSSLYSTARQATIAEQGYGVTAGAVGGGSETHIGAVSHFLARYLLPFASWDGVYFLRLAEAGTYEQEKFTAFFPLFANVSRRLAAFLGLESFLPRHHALLIAGLLLNTVCFCAAAELLYALSLRVFDHSGRRRPEVAAFALRSAYLFCLAPAGAFMAAFYSESLFIFLSFAGMLSLEAAYAFFTADAVGKFKGAILSMLGTGSFVAAAATRSNGLLLGAYVFYCALRCSHLIAGRLASKWRRIAIWGFFLLLGLGLASLCAVPYLSLSASAHATFCADDSSGTTRPWCVAKHSVYGFVQRFYWGNGFLAFYSARQIPQFILAAPMGIIASIAVALCFRGLKTGRLSELFQEFLTLLAPAQWNQEARAPIISPALPYLLHFIGLVAIGFLFMHVHVITRFVAACPAFYWCLAWAWGKAQERASANEIVQSDSTVAFNRVPTRLAGLIPWLIVCYCVGYSYVGMVLFTHFYHWT